LNVKKSPVCKGDLLLVSRIGVIGFCQVSLTTESADSNICGLDGLKGVPIVVVGDSYGIRQSWEAT